MGFKDKLRELSSKAGENAREIIGRNGRLVTAFVFSLIVVMGITLVENPSRWYIPAGLVVVFFLALFVFANARVFVKATATSALLLFVSAAGYQSGNLFDPNGAGGILWFAAVLVPFFINLSYSYAKIHGRSRWGALSFSMIGSFLLGYAVFISSLSMNAGIITTAVSGIVFFVALYRFTRKSRYRQRNMPLNITTDEITERLEEDAKKSKYTIRPLVDGEKHDGHYLIFKDRAYLLVPVVMDQPFSVIGNRRKIGLGYKARNINPWLIDQIFNRTPFWRSKGSDIMTVLLDVKNANGDKAKTLGVDLPDSKKFVPVGIMPASKLIGNHRSKKLIESIDETFKDHVQDLSPRQYKALRTVGISGTQELESDEDAESRRRLKESGKTRPKKTRRKAKQSLESKSGSTENTIEERSKNDLSDSKAVDDDEYQSDDNAVRNESSER